MFDLCVQRVVCAQACRKWTSADQIPLARIIVGAVLFNPGGSYSGIVYQKLGKRGLEAEFLVLLMVL